VYHVGVPVGTSVDFRLYRNDPEVYQRFFTPVQYPGGLSYSVSVEGSYLTQTLADPDEFGTTVPQPARAGALQASAKYNYLRMHMLGLVRDISFIQFDVPGLTPYTDFPDGTELKPEMFVAVGADYHFPGAHFTPGFIVGVQQPASARSTQTGFGGNNPPESLAGGRTLVLRDVSQPTVLPEGEEAQPIISAKTTFRWDLSESVAAVGEVYYNYDTNRVTFRDDLSGIAQPSFVDPHGVGFNMLLQARF
jgi:hypothetical protein